jgi:SAM-dependent methyltransferase
MMEIPEKDRMIKYYEDLFVKYGYDHRSLDWKDPKGQKVRYSVLFSVVEMVNAGPGMSILDVGSGLGHFYGYLKENKLLEKYKIKYKGYDISPRLVEAAKKKYPEADFEVKDILEGYFTERFDFCFSSGVFNINLTTVDEHEAFVREMIQRMYECSNLAAAVNFLSVNGVQYLVEKTPGSVYHYFNPEDVIRFVRSFTGRYDLRHDYHLADFTVYLFKEMK